MYCGDETGSFVGDVGSNLGRFGYGGEDTPKYCVPSYVARIDDENETRRYSIPTSCYNPRWVQNDCDVTSVLRMASSTNDEPVVDPTHFLQQGDSVANDWDAYGHVWQSAFDALHVRDCKKHTMGGEPYAQNVSSKNQVQSTTLSTKSTVKSPNEGKCVHPLLVVTPGCTHRVGTVYDTTVHRKELAQLTELLMEQMDCQALFIAPTPMLAAFSHGRQTALVVDVGAAGCRVTPVVDGLLLKQAQRRNGRGGDWLGNIQWKALLQQPATASFRPRYQLHSNYHGTTQKTGVFHRWAMQDLMYEFRTTSEFVQLPQWAYDPSVPFMKAVDDKDAMQQDDSGATYQLPDGTVIDLTTPIGKDLCRLPELLFTDETPFLQDSTSSTAILQEHATLSDLPLHKLVHDSLTAVGDVDVRKDLANNILLCGGASVDLERRLSLEIPRVVASGFRTKVLASRHSVERSCAAWIGGSILTSLGSFQQLWLSRDEYQEYGGTLAVQRFP